MLSYIPPKSPKKRLNANTVEKSVWTPSMTVHPHWPSIYTDHPSTLTIHPHFNCARYITRKIGAGQFLSYVYSIPLSSTIHRSSLLKFFRILLFVCVIPFSVHSIASGNPRIRLRQRMPQRTRRHRSKLHRPVGFTNEKPDITRRFQFWLGSAKNLALPGSAIVPWIEKFDSSVWAELWDTPRVLRTRFHEFRHEIMSARKLRHFR